METVLILACSYGEMTIHSWKLCSGHNIRRTIETWDHWDYDFIFHPWYRLSTLWSHVESGYFSMAASPHKGTKGAASIWIGNVFLETHTSFWVWALRNFAAEGVRLDHSLDPVDLPDHPGENMKQPRWSSVDWCVKKCESQVKEQ